MAVRAEMPRVVEEDEENIYKMVVIGETGSGKTCLVKFLLNYSRHFMKEFDLRDISSLPQIKKYAGRSMISDTKTSTKYSARFGHFKLGVIDTPGFADTDGPVQRKENIQNIISLVKSEQYVNCVCIVINGTQSRYTEVTKEVFSAMVTVLSRAVLQQIIVVFTNARDRFNMTFDPKLLEDFNLIVPKKRTFNIDNPYARWEKATEFRKAASEEDQDESDDEDENERTKREFKAGHKTLDKLFAEVKQFKPALTQKFGEFHDSFEDIELCIAELRTHYINLRQVESKIAQLKSYLEANEPKLRRDMRYYQKTTVKTSKDKNLICNADDCLSNCHRPCNCWFTFITVRACTKIRGGKCTVCSHSYKDHKVNHYHYHKEETEIPILNFDMDALIANVREKKNVLEIEKSYLRSFEKNVEDSAFKLEGSLRRFQSIGSSNYFSAQTVENLQNIKKDIDDLTEFKHKKKIQEIIEEILAVLQDPIAAGDCDAKFQWACGFLEINPENPNEEDIHRQFRLKSRESHPDAGISPSARIFRLYNHAKDYLAQKLPKWNPSQH